MYKGFDFKSEQSIQYKEYNTKNQFLNNGILGTFEKLRFGEYMSIISTIEEIKFILDLVGTTTEINMSSKLVVLHLGYDAHFFIEPIDLKSLSKIDCEVLLVNEDYLPYSYTKGFREDLNNIMFYHIGTK